MNPDCAVAARACDDKALIFEFRDLGLSSRGVFAHDDLDLRDHRHEGFCIRKRAVLRACAPGRSPSVLAEGGGTFAEVRNEARKVLATLRTNMATGSTCMEKDPYSVLNSEELPALEQDGMVPRFIFETRGDGAQPGAADTPAAACGITSSQLPEGDTTCAMFQFFTWPPNAASFGAFYNPEYNQTPGSPSLPYLELAKNYAGTAEKQDIRRMITSLRPAG